MMVKTLESGKSSDLRTRGGPRGLSSGESTLAAALRIPRIIIIIVTKD